MSKPGAPSLLRLWGKPRGRTVLAVALLLVLLVPTASSGSEGASATLDYELSGTLGNNGWWVSNVTIKWIPTPEPDSTTCIINELVEGDTAGETRTCTATWNGAGTRSATTDVIKIDQTPPSSVKARALRRPDVYGWYGRRVRFVFRGTDALSGIASCSRRLYDGPNRARASVTGSCKDVAGNSTARTVGLKYSRPLLRPQRGKRVRRAPLLDWVTVTNARFYNVQVWRDDRKILTRWPRRSRLQMPRRWTHGGVRYSVAVPGRYDVYVWPRFKGRYGKSIGHTYFIRR